MKDRTEPGWVIESFAGGGEGFARAPDGRAAFVPGAFPGDVIRPDEILSKRSFVRVSRWTLIQPSTDRVELPCSIAGACGGCPWMPLRRDVQLRAKGVLIEMALQRIGRFDVESLSDPIEVANAGDDLGWRGRVRLHIDRDGALGFHRTGSHDLVPVERCPIATAPINRLLRRLIALRLEHPAGLRPFKSLELRSAPLGPEISGLLVPRRRLDRAPAATVALFTALGGDLPIRITGIDQLLGSAEEQRWPSAGGDELSAPIGVFTQVHQAVNGLLIEALLGGAARRGASSFVDLYAGTGNLTLALLRAGLSGAGVEGQSAAALAGRANVERAGFGSDRICGERVERWLRDRGEQPAPDLLVMDPPRAGAKSAVPGILAMRPRAIACVSCDPGTLARDLRRLVDGGYTLCSVQGFDMFPHTPHVEILAWLDREP